MLRCVIALVAIAISATLAVRNQNSMARLRQQASLLDLTHDTVFVRDRDDVITYWNRAATALYGWDRDEAIGRRTHDLLHTEFPKPLPEIMADLMRTDHWEGELVHPVGTVREGSWIGHEIRQPLAAIVAHGEAGLRWLGLEVPDLAEARSSI
jgi:two-component system, LuxR family, sensor kinase FixL